jgi:lipopolysaccharide/colanic/teichoic acid biosynthesis glycosyltransferase
MRGLSKMDIKQMKWKVRPDQAYDYYYRFYDFHDEDSFNRKLYLERKRTERSNKPFLLMLIDISELLKDDTESQFLKKLVSVLFSATRDIDIKGWYQYDTLIGILYSEIENITDAIKDRLYHKIHDSLAKVLDTGSLDKIEIIFRVFPEKSEDDGDDGDDEFNRNLYKDKKKPNTSKKYSLFFKRAIDIAGSLVAITLFFPLFLIISVLIKLTSDGPILFRQERVGMLGKKFTFLKFRSMYVDNDVNTHKEYIRQFISGSVAENGVGEEKQATVFKLRGDNRITTIGNYIRKTSLDELPQFFNVLRGDMSLVGPRPPIPYECDQYDIWHRRRVMEMKPGITGLWQIEGRSVTTFDEMVRLDLKYIQEWSPWLDIKILVKTPMVVLTMKGAY